MGDRRLFRTGGRIKSLTPIPPAAPAEPAKATPAEIPPGSPHAVDTSCVRSLKTVHGVISDVSLRARGDAPALEARIDPLEDEVADEDRVVLVWLGRDHIAGVQPGREIVATARICAEGGGHVMYNPRYDLR